MTLSLETWNGIMEHQAIIRGYFDNTDNLNPLFIGPLTVKFIKFNNEKCICLDLNNVRMMLMAFTTNRMLSLDKCIDYMYNWLLSCIDTVDSKYQQFLSMTYYMNNPNDVTACIEKSNCFNPNELIDCELLSLAF